MNVDRPRVSVVVPVYNDVGRLRTCLTALAAQSYPRHLFEVVVVDNASTEDLSVAVPHDDRFRLVRESAPGSYAARNRGISVATGSVLAFTDSDCVPGTDWLEQGVRALLEEPRADIVGGAIELFYRGAQPVTGAELYEAHHGFPQRVYVTERGFAATANMLTWRSTFEETGVFNDRLMSHGDAEWGRRVSAGGGVLRYCEQAVVRHPARATWSELGAKVARVAAGRRDADLLAGRSRSYFVRFALGSLWSFMRACVGVWRRPFPASGRDKLRYLGATGASRVLLALIMWRAAVEPRGRRGAPGSPTPPT